jgi:hypothetical protein
MLAALILPLALGQIQKYEITFDVESVNGSAAPVATGTSTYSSFLGAEGERGITWTYKSSLSDTGWRRQWTYDTKGFLTYQSYEVSFGDAKSRWTLSKDEAGAWSLTGIPLEKPVSKSMRIQDESVFWFKLKQVKPGAQARISKLDTGNFTAVEGRARFSRIEEMKVGDKVYKVNVVERIFPEESEVWYYLDNGTPLRIDQVYARAGTNLIFKPRQ